MKKLPAQNQRKRTAGQSEAVNEKGNKILKVSDYK